MENEDEERQKRLDDWLHNEQLRTENSIPKNQASFEHDSGKTNPNAESKSKLGDRLGNKSEEESEDESEEEKHIMLPALDSVRTFILKSEAFLKFQQKLRDFIYPTLTSELENLAQMFSPQGLARERTNTGSTEAMECYHQLEGLVLDLISVDLDSILIRYRNLCTRWDRIKLFAEWTTGHRWDWWPFSDPAGPLRHGSAYVFWRCVSKLQ